MIDDEKPGVIFSPETQHLSNLDYYKNTYLFSTWNA